MNATATKARPTSENGRVRSYLTEREVERLIAAARKHSRYGARDAAMILIGYRHGLRASELCSVQWSEVELDAGRLHIRRAKGGHHGVHPLTGVEIRALRALRRDHPDSRYVFVTERGGPMTPDGFNDLFDGSFPSQWVSAPPAPTGAPALALDLPHAQAAVRPASPWGGPELFWIEAWAASPSCTQFREHGIKDSSHESFRPLRSGGP
jgi:hypothetical protein